MNFRKLKRLPTKIMNLIRSILFHISYYAIEAPYHSYKQYLKKRNIKNLKISFPVINSIEFNNVNFLIYIESSGSIENSILKDGVWEDHTLKIIENFIKRNSLIVDVGANIGFMSLYLSKKYPDCLVYSYEPTSYAYESLKKSKELNDLNNLKVFQLAVGEGNYPAEIYAPTKKTGPKMFASIQKHFNIDDTFTKEKVQVVSLDDHVHEPCKISFIKIDVQGFELNVFRGAQKTLEKNRPVIIFEHEDEYCQDPLETRKSIHDLLSDLGYEFYLIRSSHYKKPYSYLSPYTFLEKTDIKSVPYVHGDLVALPV